MRIARPLLFVMTPLGVAWGMVEAWRFHWWLALLMAAALAVVGTLTWLTIRRIRADRADEVTHHQEHGRGE
jgi:membrane protein implicated in regulation of membrane protease activity